MSSPFIHPSALCESREIGDDTRIEAFARVAPGARIGRNCHVGSHVVIESDMIVEDDVIIGAGAHFSCGFQTGRREASGQPVVLRRGCRIGANAAIASGVTIGEEAFVEAGAMVTQSVQPHAIVTGNPARVTGFANTPEAPAATGIAQVRRAIVTDSKVRGVRAFDLPFIADPRGNLTVGEFGRELPFVPKRYFITFDVPSFHLRGEHAHRECEQFLICVRGSCALVVDDGTNREEFLLDRPTIGVHVPPMVWATEYKHSPDSTLLVFASHHYDPADYIRDYSQFLGAVGRGTR